MTIARGELAALVAAEVRAFAVEQLKGYADRPTITVEQAAEVLLWKRSRTYDASRRYLDTDGAEGLPSVRVSAGRVVVPTAALLGFLLALPGESS